MHYYFSDHLGSTSMTTDANGTMSACPTNSSLITGEDESDYYPYGGEQPLCNRVLQNYKFTGKERDSESGLDNFGARFDASSLGRFMSVDAAGIQLVNPQSWNRYIFTLNNPLRFIDPNGFEAVEIAVFSLTVWVSNGMTFMAGDLLTAGGSAVTMARPEPDTLIRSNGDVVPWRGHNQGTLNTANNLAVGDANDFGPLCPPVCVSGYFSVTHAYSLVADFQIDLSDSSKSKVTLSEQRIAGPEIGGPTRHRAWPGGAPGPPPEFRNVNVRTSNLKKLSYRDLVGLVGALREASAANSADDALGFALMDAQIEQNRRQIKAGSCKEHPDDPACHNECTAKIEQRDIPH